MSANNIAIIVPVAPKDEAWRDLAKSLSTLNPAPEILWSATEALAPPVGKVLIGDKGRAKQLNRAVRSTEVDWLWFLHADSYVSVADINHVLTQKHLSPNTLYYCGLKFDGGPLMRINEFGVWFRSRFLKMPFGDQGFLIHRDLIARTGGFNEEAPYGEDHLLVWKIRQCGGKIAPLGISVKTSARKYEKNGWLRTTLKHNVLTWKQAFPELFRGSVSHSGAAAGAVVVFVKTPGLSPVKTRLAASVGETEALRFYKRSVELIQSAVNRSVRKSRWSAYWAVAEKEAVQGSWPEWESIWQGEGDLGARLAHVYETLLNRHEWVIFLGGDCPLVTPELLSEAITILEKGESKFVMGDAEDGGFYLFGGGRGLSADIWKGVQYSTEKTAHELRQKLSGRGTIHDLPQLLDVDTQADWEKVKTLCPEVFN